ncbi:MAG: hypothetical protein SWX82_23805 [Cyanobacteriota bacterium]|nr:hypothetical protein [Cyanobacteriota bacterium]
MAFVLNISQKKLQQIPLCLGTPRSGQDTIVGKMLALKTFSLRATGIVEDRRKVKAVNPLKG